MSNETAVALRDKLPALAGSDIFATAESFEHAQRVAKVFSSSALVPEHLKKQPADALIAYGIARRLGEDPLVVMQNIYFVNGKPGWSVKYKIARANKAGVFKDQIRWRSEGEGEGLRVTAFATLEDGEIAEAETSMKMAKAEGWTKNAKYSTMPGHMLRWRSASMLIDLYCPEVMLGLPTLHDEPVYELKTGADGTMRASALPMKKKGAAAAILDGAFETVEAFETTEVQPGEPVGDVVDPLTGEVIDGELVEDV